tara:strand:+ start:128 stop:451 length:324 start_codon:yes stop_codon:yes gene_type:complete
MSTFEERKKGYEAKYIKDQESEFKIRAKRNRLVGLWAAEKINTKNIDDYVKEVRLADLEKPGDDDIVDKLIKDFDDLNLNITREEILKKIEECYELAIGEYIKETKV